LNVQRCKKSRKTRNRRKTKTQRGGEINDRTKTLLNELIARNNRNPTMAELIKFMYENNNPNYSTFEVQEYLNYLNH